MKGLDIATGKQVVGKNYLTKGTAKSTYMEGNSTIQFKVVDPDTVYNTTTNAPNPPKSGGGGGKAKRKRYTLPFGKTL